MTSNLLGEVWNGISPLILRILGGLRELGGLDAGLGHSQSHGQPVLVDEGRLWLHWDRQRWQLWLFLDVRLQGGFVIISHRKIEYKSRGCLSAVDDKTPNPNGNQ